MDQKDRAGRRRPVRRIDLRIVVEEKAAVAHGLHEESASDAAPTNTSCDGA